MNEKSFEKRWERRWFGFFSVFSRVVRQWYAFMVVYMRWKEMVFVYLVLCRRSGFWLHLMEFWRKDDSDQDRVSCNCYFLVPYLSVFKCLSIIYVQKMVGGSKGFNLDMVKLQEICLCVKVLLKGFPPIMRRSLQSCFLAENNCCYCCCCFLGEILVILQLYSFPHDLQQLIHHFMFPPC